MSKVETTGGSLDGLVTDVQVFNRILTEEENLGYTNCNIKLTGDIASWENDQDWEIVGDVKFVEVDSKRICTSRDLPEEPIMVFPALLNYPGMYFSPFSDGSSEYISYLEKSYNI